MGTRSPHGRSWTDANGNYHYREFASEKAADNWADGRGKVDADLVADRMAREAERDAKRWAREDAKRRTAQRASTYEYHKPEKYPGVDAEWNGASGRVGGRRYTNYWTWVKWANAAAEKAARNQSEAVSGYVKTWSASSPPARPASPVSPLPAPTRQPPRPAPAQPTVASGSSSFVGCVGTALLVWAGLLVFAVIGWIVSLLLGA